MSIQYQILCSTKSTVKGTTTITHIGGRNPLGEVWILKITEAIEGIRAGKWNFFMNLSRHSYPILLVQTATGTELTTAGTAKNLLMELPDCPL